MIKKPNVLYIDCHDLGDWLGCYGRDYLNTPHLDKLATEGVRFDQYFSTAPICQPSRVSMYAGKYPHEAGCLGQMPYDEDTPMIAQAFQAAGYRTINCGWNTKNKASWAGYERSAPFKPSHPDSHTILEELASEQTDKPFFAHFAFSEVHRLFGNGYDPELVDHIPLPEGYYEHEISRKDLATLCRYVTELDAHVGRILNALEQNNLSQNTLIIFTTEHGAAILRAKHTMYDRAFKTTLLMRLPGVLPQGVVFPQMISSIDLVPTIYELTDVAPQGNLSGQSLCPLFSKEAQYCERKHIFFEHTWDRAGMGGPTAAQHTANLYVPKRAVRTRQYKLVRHFTDLPNTIDSDWLERYRGVDNCLEEIQNAYGQASPEYELFDIQTDPEELHNLAKNPEYTDVLSKLKTRLQQHLEETNDPILQGDVAHREGFEIETMWVKQKDGNYHFHPKCPRPDLNQGESPFWRIEKNEPGGLI